MTCESFIPKQTSQKTKDVSRYMARSGALAGESASLYTDRSQRFVPTRGISL